MSFEENNAAIGSEARSIHSEFDRTGITWIDRPNALQAFKDAGHEITFDGDGNPVSSYDREPRLPLSECLTRFALDNRSLIDARTLPQNTKTGRSAIASKSELKTNEEKMDFINKFGGEAYRELPLSPPKETVELRYMEDYSALPNVEKVRLIATHGEAWLHNLPRRPVQSNNEQTLEKFKAKEPWKFRN